MHLNFIMMNRYFFFSSILLTLLICTIPGYSQENIHEEGNFRFDKDERLVSWIKIFEPSESIDINALKDYFFDDQILEIISEDSSSFVGKFIPKPIDIQKYGYKRMKTPMFLLDVEQIFNAQIEFKEGRYRVILSDMGYIDNGVLSDLTSRALVGQTSTTAKGNFVTYDGEFSFNNKNEVRSGFVKSLEILEAFYTDVFEYKVKPKISSDW